MAMNSTLRQNSGRDKTHRLGEPWTYRPGDCTGPWQTEPSGGGPAATDSGRIVRDTRIAIALEIGDDAAAALERGTADTTSSFGRSPMMTRVLSTALLAVVVIAQASRANQGPIQRAGQAIDNAGKNIRRGVETGVARGQITAQERELLGRVTQRIKWDKQLVSSTLQLVVQADGTVSLRGSVMDEAAKARAVDLVENTVGVTAVVDELAVVKDVKVIQARPARVIETVPTRVIEVPAESRIIVPAETKVIVKP